MTSGNLSGGLAVVVPPAPVGFSRSLINLQVQDQSGVGRTYSITHEIGTGPTKVQMVTRTIAAYGSHRNPGPYNITGTGVASTEQQIGLTMTTSSSSVTWHASWAEHSIEQTDDFSIGGVSAQIAGSGATYLRTPLIKAGTVLTLDSWTFKNVDATPKNVLLRAQMESSPGVSIFRWIDYRGGLAAGAGHSEKGPIVLVGSDEVDYHFRMQPFFNTMTRFDCSMHYQIEKPAA